MFQDHRPAVNRIAFIGNHIPRKCGIATFTTDLAEAVAAQYPNTDCIALAMNDIEGGYAYLPRVKFELSEDDQIAYKRAADYLNVNDVDVVNLQHEYGIFGGPAGSNILELLRDLRMPIVTTLHTVLKEPDPVQLKVLQEISQLSSRLVVMSQRGIDYLTQIYRIPSEKIDFIHHGIPDVPFVDPNFYKDHFGVEGKIVLLTFGLLSANKGIENVLLALPEIVKQYPNLVYIVLGATHPSVLKTQGEAYRDKLQHLVKELNIQEHVIFDNRFVTEDELVEFIGAADIYITPYLNPQQITSGTLAYTVGAGKAVISTPYWYAEELLAEDRGVLVPFGKPEKIAEKVIYLLQNEAERHAIRKRAYLLGREMIWSKVAQRSMESFERARLEPVVRPYISAVSRKLETKSDDLPPLNLYHLSRLTDSTGILQHAVFNLPNYREGYTTDDNARGLIAGILLERLGDEWFTGAAEFASRYLSFLFYAYNPELGRFRNFFSFERHWLEEHGSEDSHGRSIQSLGMVCGHSMHEQLRSVATMLFNWSLPAALELTSPRAWSFTLLGVNEYLKRFSGDRTAQSAAKELAERLLNAYQSNNGSDWRWFEPTVTYANASLSHALLVAGNLMNHQEMLDVGLESLNWLAKVQRSESGFFSPVGSNGFYKRGMEKARFDQQPIEACAMVSASLEAYRITGDQYWHKEAQRAFRWFLGENDLGLSLYDPTTGGCRDGLHPDRVNQNQGAESTLAFLVSLLEFRLSDQEIQVGQNGKNPQITILSLNTHPTMR
ncbi:MAG TPA: glycosyltransferase [Anaerolineaceae bacterium]|nr:glycosyltransferase [Anaerolineaceae bacterium]